jgi:hypothetical protein
MKASVFFCGDAASLITGHNRVIDGGYSIHKKIDESRAAQAVLSI